MIESLSIGASGMQAQQTQIDVIANNLANVNTMGFKKSRGRFRGPDVQGGWHVTESNLLPTFDLARPVGVGVGVSSTGKVFTSGEVKKD